MAQTITVAVSSSLQDVTNAVDAIYLSSTLSVFGKRKLSSIAALTTTGKLTITNDVSHDWTPVSAVRIWSRFVWQ